MKTIGEKLKLYRKAKGLTLQQAADAIDKSNGQVSHWETGRHEPSLSDLRKLAVLYGCTLGDFVGESELVAELKEEIMQLKAVVKYFREDSGDFGKKPRSTRKTVGMPPFALSGVILSACYRRTKSVQVG